MAPVRIPSITLHQPESPSPSPLFSPYTDREKSNSPYSSSHSLDDIPSSSRSSSPRQARPAAPDAEPFTTIGLNHRPTIEDARSNGERSRSPSNSSHGSGSPSGGKPAEEKVTWMSLPHKGQLLILALCRLSEPLSNTCLLPYLYYLIRSLQPEASAAAPTADASSRSASSISLQAGLLVALFALLQFATSMPWSWAANHWGRKPCIVIGLALSIVSNVGFGFSRSLTSLFVWRALAGAANGNIGVLRTVTAEVVKERKYQSRAFLLLPLVFNMGNVVGLAVGGWLAEPVIRLPGLFGTAGWFNFGGVDGGVKWLVAYPFALPAVWNAWVLMGSLALAIFGLRETMAGLEDRKDWGLEVGGVVIRAVKRVLRRGKAEGYMAVGEDDADHDFSEGRASKSAPTMVERRPTNPPPSAGPPPKAWTTQVLYMLLSFFILPLHNAAFMNVFPIFLSTPPSTEPATSLFSFTGGLGLSSATIGLYLSAFGIFGILIQLLIYPSLQSALSTLGAYRLALFLFLPAYAIAPYLALIPSSRPVLQGICICVVLFLQVTARTFAIPSSVILLTNSAPSPKVLGTVHGAGNMVGSLARAVGPAAAGAVLGWGIRINTIGVVWWAYLGVVAVGGLVWSWWLREGSPKGVGAGKPGPRGMNDVERGRDVELVSRGDRRAEERYKDEK